MDEAERRYVDALLGALVRDLRDHPVPGRLARVVVRWFEASDPLYLTIHALGTDQESAVAGGRRRWGGRLRRRPGDAWLPLEWDNVDEEMERTDRVLSDPAVQAAGRAVAELHGERPDLADGEFRAPPALVELARRARDAFRAADIEVAEHMLLLPSHFEGEGARQVMQQIEPPEAVLAALRARGAVPD
jgi:hypothetical protein